MKQLYSIYLLSAIILGLVSCGDNRQERISDLINYELKGKVKLCKKVTYIVNINDRDTVKKELSNEYALLFSENGILSKFGGQELVYDEQGNLVPNQLLDSIVRNDKQQMVRMVYAGKCESGKSIALTYWTYDDNGYPATIKTCENTIENVVKSTYDDNGTLIKNDSEIYNGQRYTISETYDYLEFDEHGNWVRRLCKQKSDDVKGLLAIQERVITYYGEDSESVSEEDILFEEIIIPITTSESDGVKTYEISGETKYVPVDVIEEEDPEQIFEVVENMPEYPGGQATLMKFIAQNLQYPTVAKEAGTQGRVIVQFVVEQDGTITNAKAVRNVEPSLDQEAVRIINAMPKWKPGMQRGKPVRVKLVVPVMFRLN